MNLQCFLRWSRSCHCGSFKKNPLHQHVARNVLHTLRTPSRSGIHTRLKGMPGSWSPKAVKTSTGPGERPGIFRHLRDHYGGWAATQLLRIHQGCEFRSHDSSNFPLFFHTPLPYLQVIPALCLCTPRRSNHGMLENPPVIDHVPIQTSILYGIPQLATFDYQRKKWTTIPLIPHYIYKVISLQMGLMDLHLGDTVLCCSAVPRLFPCSADKQCSH